MLSLIGIPFTGGFFGKFYVFSAALHAGHVWLAVIGLLNSGVACFYYLRLIAAVYTRPQTDLPTGLQTASPISAAAGVPRFASAQALSIPAGVGLGLAALATLLLGILPGRALSLAQQGSAATVPQTQSAPSVEAAR